MTKIFRTLLGLSLGALLLTACGTMLFNADLTPRQQAWLLTKEYTAAAEATKGYIESPFAQAEVVSALAQADAVAFAYVEQTNLRAQAIDTAGEAERPAATAAFSSVYQTALTAVMRLKSLIAPVTAPAT